MPWVEGKPPPSPGKAIPAFIETKRTELEDLLTDRGVEGHAHHPEKTSAPIRSRMGAGVK
jgi:hypothetical protein